VLTLIFYRKGKWRKMGITGAASDMNAA